MTLLAIAVGAAAGALSGCGVGGGTLLLLYLGAVVGVEPRAAAGANLAYFLFCAPAALIRHRQSGLLSRSVIFPAVLCGTVTAAAAALVGAALPTDWIRRGFGGILLYVGFSQLRGGTKTTRRK